MSNKLNYKIKASTLPTMIKNAIRWGGPEILGYYNGGMSASETFNAIERWMNY